jgi:hypothetical protein
LQEQLDILHLVSYTCFSLKMVVSEFNSDLSLFC